MILIGLLTCLIILEMGKMFRKYVKSRKTYRNDIRESGLLQWPALWLGARVFLESEFCILMGWFWTLFDRFGTCLCFHIFNSFLSDLTGHLVQFLNNQYINF